ncbi:hypothetical protein CASFOL_030363 [Castilleja foliolosa]|uniref:Uncharacterized protein n=1 Tax=Castilleja foliolosa TaxID=1961234 RepID=A0ABD3C8X4_9LAMI
MVSPPQKKAGTTTGETSAVLGVSEPNVVAPSTGAEERENLPVDVKVEPDALPSLRSRNSWAALFQSLKDINDVQRNAVREMGFGLLLYLDAPKELPTKLCYWLLDNFDPVMCDVVLNNGIRLHVDDVDVKYVLGLPDGTTNIERRPKCTTHHLVEEFRGMFNGTTAITARKVITKMLSKVDGRLWFKRLFLIAMTSNLIECFPRCFATLFWINYETCWYN